MLFCGELWRIFLKVFTPLTSIRRVDWEFLSLIVTIFLAFWGSMVITIDTEEKCLLLYPSYKWSRIQDKISNLPSFNKNARRIQRLLIGHAEDIEVDSNGRILISKPLRDYAELEKK